MPSLYAAAYLTVAAAHGIDGTAGIFYENPTARPPRTLSLQVPHRRRASETVRVALTPGVRRLPEDSLVHRLYGSDDEITSPSFRDEGLLTRAWAFQERALSTRIVHFTRDEVVWECKQCRRCECGVLNGASFLTSLVGSVRRRLDLEDEDEEPSDGESGAMSTASSSPSSGRQLSARPPRRHWTDMDEHPGFRKSGGPESIWWKFVTYYTTRKLTRPTDRSPAFRGIAEVFGGMMRNLERYEELGAYCAGVWECHLPGSLLWAQPIGEGRRLPGSAEPSWSWYSVTGVCHEVKWGIEGLGHILLHQRELKDVYATYDAKGGSLTLSNIPLAAVTRASLSDCFRFKGGIGQSASLTTHSVTLLADDPNDETGVLDAFCLTLTHGEHQVWAEPKDLSHLSEDELEYLMMADDGGEEFEPGYGECRNHAVGIALVADGTSYRRVGLFHLAGASCVGMGYTNKKGPRLPRELIEPFYCVAWDRGSMAIIQQEAEKKGYPASLFCQDLLQTEVLVAGLTLV